MTDSEILEEINKYKWYHKIKVTDNISTPGTMNQQHDTSKIIKNISFIDKRVLDIGCRDGKFCFESEKLGASKILGIDTCLSLGAKNFLIPFFNSKVELAEKSVYDLSPTTEGFFDIVFFIGILYHLKYPFYALKKVSDVMENNSILILETAIWHNTDNKALLWCPTLEESPYPGSSLVFFNYKGLEDNLKVFGFNDFAYMSDKQNDDKISRLTLKCTKKPLSTKYSNLHKYWSGETHKTWIK